MKRGNNVLFIAIILIVATALSRVWLYPLSFSPLIAMSLFGGAALKDRKVALLIPILAIILSDILLEVTHTAKGFYGGAQYFDFGMLVMITLLGSYMKKINVVNIALYSLIACVGFYLISNTANFILSNPQYHTYPQTFGGYLLNMEAGLPFLGTSLLSTAIYDVVFFGLYALSMKYYMQKQVA